MDSTVNMKEKKYKEKYMDLVVEMKNLWNRKIPVVIGALRMILQSLEKKMEIIENQRYNQDHFGPQHCWDQLEYPKESWRSVVTCSHSVSSESLPCKTGVKNSQ